MNLLEATVRAGRLDLGPGASLPLPGGYSTLGDGLDVVVGIRPEYVDTVAPDAAARRRARG